MRRPLLSAIQPISLTPRHPYQSRTRLAAPHPPFRHASRAPNAPSPATIKTPKRPALPTYFTRLTAPHTYHWRVYASVALRKTVRTWPAVMASYFELPPQQATAAASIQGVSEQERKRLGGMSFLSPAVTQLLEDLGDEKSDSGSEEGSPSEEEQTKHGEEPLKKNGSRESRADKQRAALKPTKSSLSPSKGERSQNNKSVQVKLPSVRADSGSSARPKQPHMARLHSLRSMLFSTTIEDKMKTMTQQDCQREQMAASKWKDQHQQRQLHSRPKTPEKDVTGKDSGLGSRLRTKIRRMTSKEVPTMQTLEEDGAAHDFSDHGSTASSDNEFGPYRWKPREADEESIDHSDVEELVRWVSRRDPPSDGEARNTVKIPAITIIKEDSGHESIGDSDVDDLVQWMSRKASQPDREKKHHTGYSDASTESDSEMANADQSSEDEDSEDLVRWVSHRDGPKAGPVRKQKQAGSRSSDPEDHVNSDRDVPDIARFNRSDVGTGREPGATSSAHESLLSSDEPERGRPRSREGPSRPKAKGHMTNDDVDELIRWVSRKEAKPETPQDHNQSTAETRGNEHETKTNVRISNDSNTDNNTDSESDSDAEDDLLAFIKPRDKPSLELEPSVQAPPLVTTSSAPARPGMGETGELRRLQTSDREARKPAAQEHLEKTRRESTQIQDKDMTIK